MSFPAPVLKPKKCRHCKQEFKPWSSTQVICFGTECARAFVAAKREQEEQRAARAKAKAAREEDKVRREKLKTAKDWIPIAQKAFNDYIRLRDQHLPCICCGQWNAGDYLTGGEWDAGHFRSRGAAPHLRFDERNAHRQLKQCNRRAWDVASYRANLIGRIGLAAVEALEADQTPRKHSVDDLKAITAVYRARRKELEKA